MKRIPVESLLTHPSLTGGIVITQGKRGVVASHVDHVSLDDHGLHVALGATMRLNADTGEWRLLTTRARVVTADRRIPAFALMGTIGVMKKDRTDVLCIRVDRAAHLLLRRGLKVKGVPYVALPDFSRSRR